MVSRADNGIYRCYLVQILLIAAAAAATLFLQGVAVMLAVLYGGGITVLNTWLLARRVTRAVTSEHLVAHSQVGVIERLCVAVTMITLGFVVLDLSPVGPDRGTVGSIFRIPVRVPVAGKIAGG